ncbi:MAG: histidine phosphatase family protein [Clostridia bacterium]|nr:histidine phosphatase family protein [Clostridia bacterium]
MRILIIRHGDPDYEHDCLTEKGKREAALLAKWLKNENITAFYSSPLGRAKETCKYVAKEQGREKEIVVLPWLQEFNHDVTYPKGRQADIPWDMLPEEWKDEPQMYSLQWYEHECYTGSGLKEKYLQVTGELDKLLQKHGYVREGGIYKAEKPNRDTIALFCHFGLESVLLSRLCDTSPVLIWHHFVALPTSVTTLYTEERREGKAVFRCSGFGDTGHLRSGGEPLSFSARFCETYDSLTERRD